MAKSAFTEGFFADPVKPQRCTAEPVRPLDGINKDVGGAKLLLTTTADDHRCLSCGLCLYLSLTEDTAPLSVS